MMTKSSIVRLGEIAELLGVTKQRAHQIADEPRSTRRSNATAEAALGPAGGRDVDRRPEARRWRG